MKKFSISMVLVALFAFSFTLASPKLRIVEGDLYNWGQVKAKDSPLKTQVHIVNDGDSLLVLTAVKPTCGCTTAPLDKSELKHGDTATVSITLNITPTGGKVSKSIRITSNDLSQSTKILALEADVMVPIDVQPTKFLPFDNVKVGQTSESRVKIKNSSNQDITLSNFESSPDYLTINLKEPIYLKPNSEVELIAKVKPDKAGYFNCWIKMKTTHPDYPDFTIYGYGNVAESPVFNNTK